MFLEAALLLALVLLVPFADADSVTFIIVGLAVLILCIPAIKLIRQAAPPFVPTPKKTVEDMIKLANLQPGERVYDLGCGDGRFLIAAAEKGAHAVGYELSLPTYLLARFRTMGRRNIEVRFGDFWTKDFGDADVIVCYLLSGKMSDFQQKIWPRLKPGTRVVSHSFTMPEIEPVEKTDDAALYVK